jgi:predicted enzyme related to lactoylglutathione lyase
MKEGQLQIEGSFLIIDDESPRAGKPWLSRLPARVWRNCMNKNPASWFEIYVQDMARARRFYEAVLQVELRPLNDAQPELWAFPQSLSEHGASGALARMEGFSSGGNSTLIYFSCADCGVEEQRIVPAGGRILKGKFSIGEYGFIVLAFDTEGNLFGLHSMP